MILLGELNLSALVIIVLKFESIVYKNEQNDGNPGLKLESLLNTKYSTMDSNLIHCIQRDSNLSPLYTMDSNLSPLLSSLCSEDFQV